MSNTVGSLIQIEGGDSYSNKVYVPIHSHPLQTRIADATAKPLESTPPKQPARGFFGKLYDWYYGPTEDTTTKKVNATFTPQLLRDPSGIFTPDDDQDEEPNLNNEDGEESFDSSAEQEEPKETEQKESKNEDRLPLRSNGFGPPGLTTWNAYGFTHEEAVQIEAEIQENKQRKIDETEDDSRGWIGYLANAAAQFPGAGKIVGQGWARDKIKSFLFGNSDFSALAEETRRELRILTGDHKLAQATETASNKLSDVVVKNVIENYPGFKNFIELEPDLVKGIVKAIVLKAALNFARNTKSTVGPDFSGDLTTQIFSDLMKITNEALDETSAEKFEEIRKIRNVNERKSQFRELFKPVAEKLLTIALPNREADLDLGKLSGSVWSSIANEAVPDLFVKLYELTHKPPHHSEEDLKELERPGGAALQKLAKYVAEKAKAIVPKAIDKSSTDISKEIVAFLTNNPEESLWLKIWLKDRLLNICTTEDPAIKRIWDYAEINIESIIIHGLASLAKKESTESDTSDKNIVPDVAGSGLKILEEFFTKNKADIDKAFEETANLSENERNTRLKAKFKPLSEKILEAADLSDNPLVGLVKEQALPSILREFYRDMYLYQEDLSTDSDQLKNRLLDPVAHINQASNELIEEYRAVLSDPENGKKVLWEKSGIGKVVDELETSCGVFAKDIIRIVKGFTGTDKKLIAEKLNSGLFKSYPMTAEEQKDFGEGLQQFLTAEGESLEKTWKYSETIVKAALFKVFAAVANNHKVEGEDDRKENKNTAILGNVIHRVLSFLNNRIPSIDAQLKQLENNPELSQDEKDLAIRKLYQPLAEDFLALAGDDLESILPVPKIVRGPLKELLKTTLLPAIFHDVYTHLNEGRRDGPENAKKLDAIVPSGSKFVQNVADYIEKFVPYYMETHPEVISKIAMKAAEKYTEALSDSSKEQLGDLIAKNVEELGKNSEMVKTSKAISEYSKALMLKMFSGITASIQGKESEKDAKGHNDFLLNTSIGFIKLMGDHVKRINEIPPDGRMYPAHIVPDKYMHKGFADEKHHKINMLHPALATDFAEGATQEDKDRQRLNEFFIPFTNDILEIAGMNDPKDLPVPEPIRQEVWELFQTKILPQVMMNVFKEVMKPESLNLLMLKTFDALNEAVDDLENVDLKDVDEEEQDEQQEKLNKALGSLIKEMVELVPDFWTMTVFDSEKIKNMTASAIGKIVRRKLEDTTMIDLLNKGLESAKMPEPGADRGKTGTEKAKENKRVEKELNQKMTAYISRHAKEKFRDYIKSKWENFHESFDKGVEKYLGKPGLAVKHFFDDILHFIFFDVLGPIFDFIVFKALWFFVDMKIAEKSKEIIKDIHMPIHENLIYNLCGEWTKSMKGQQQVEKTKQQLIEAYELKRKEEEEAARLVAEENARAEKKANEETDQIITESILKEQISQSSAKIAV